MILILIFEECIDRNFEVDELVVDELVVDEPYVQRMTSEIANRINADVNGKRIM
ncbi:MAG: hypothetical protein VKJ24_01930 [Synechococcales bacterium]|nr:hypothetical protein [Synechococcales bacterium]